LAQLAQAIEARVRPGANDDGGVRLLLLAYVDQFGICHAPVCQWVWITSNLWGTVKPYVA
jgi:hypothetical protein